MLSFDGEVKIIDFGVARGSVDDFRTAPGMIVGTLRYVSPEQAVAEPLDRRSDLYALGVVLYELLTGRPLVPEGSPIAVLNDVLHRRVRPASVINPHLPLGLDGVLALALAKDREERFPSARAMREAIEAVVGDLGRTPRERIGAYVVSECPEAYAQARELRALGALRYAEWATGGPSGVSRNTLTPPRPRVVPGDPYDLTPTEDHVPPRSITRRRRPPSTSHWTPWPARRPR
jgi:serine/threonine protein kinase